MYPWEKTTSPEPEPEAGADTEAFPWDAVAEPSEVDGSKPPVQLSAVEENLVAGIAAHGSWVLSAPTTFAYNEPEQADWRPLALVLAGAIGVGALVVFVLRQPDTSVVVTERTSEQTTTTVRSGPPAVPPAGALIRPTDTRSIVSKTIENGGRENPFRDALPPPPLPEVKPSPVPVAPPRPLPPPPPTPVFGLVSVAVSGSSRAAMIQVSGLESMPSLHEVTVGDQVEGWSVREINSQRVLLARGKKTQSLSAQ